MRGLISVMFVVPFISLPTGCGTQQSKVNVTGQLTKNNQPMKFSNDTMRSMFFYPSAEKESGTKPYPAFLNENGDFGVNEIPPGKYLITFQVIDGTGDFFKGAFSKEKSKIIRDITGSEVINIEVTKLGGK